MKKKIMLTMLCAMVGVGAISGCGASSTNTVKEETPVADPRLPNHSLLKQKHPQKQKLQQTIRQLLIRQEFVQR